MQKLLEIQMPSFEKNVCICYLDTTFGVTKFGGYNKGLNPNKWVEPTQAPLLTLARKMKTETMKTSTNASL